MGRFKAHSLLVLSRTRGVRDGLVSAVRIALFGEALRGSVDGRVSPRALGSNRLRS